jgi:hypothetical protein
MANPLGTLLVMILQNHFLASGLMPKQAILNCDDNYLQIRVRQP